MRYNHCILVVFMSAFFKGPRASGRATVVKSGASGNNACISAITCSAPPKVVSQSATIARCISHIYPTSIIGCLLYCIPMLRKPRPLPERFNRPVTPQTRRVVQQHMHRRRDYVWKRWQRTAQRWQRQAESVRRSIVRFLLFAVPATTIVCIGFFLYSPVLQIKAVRILLTDPRINTEVIQHSLTPFFGRHLFFFSVLEAEEQTRIAVPDVQDVSITKEYPSTLVVRLTLTPIVARLTIVEPDVNDGSGATVQDETRADFLTADGLYMAYADAQVGSGSDVPMVHIVDWGVRPTSGTQLLDPEFLLAMEQAQSMLREQFDRTVSLRTVFVRAREYHLQTVDHMLWFDLRTSVEDQLGRYRTFLEAKGAVAAPRYVDLRLVDKVVYQ